MTSRLETRQALGLIFVIGMFWFMTIRTGHQWGGDFSLYIHHAKNLVEGEAYAETGYHYNEDFPSVGPRIYPPGLPILLTPIYAAFGLNDLRAMKALLCVCFLGFLVVFWLSFRNRAGRAPLTMALAVTGLSPWLWNFKDQVLSEYPFLLFCYLALCVGQLSADGGEDGEEKLARGIGLGLLIYLAFAVRTVGAFLLPALVIYDWIRFRRFIRLRRELWVAIAVAMTGIIAQSLLLRAGGGYFDQLRPSPQTMLANVTTYARSLVYFFEPGYGAWAGYAITASLSLLAIVGFRARTLRGGCLHDAFLLVYLLVLVVWPESQGTRFLVPVIPIFLLYAFEGLESLVSKTEAKPGRVVALAGLVVLASFGAKFATVSWKRVPTGIGTETAIEAFEWVRENVGEDETCVFRKPRVFSLYTGRPSGCLHESDDRDAQWNFLRGIDARWLVTSPVDEDWLKDFVKDQPARFEERYWNPELRVLRIVWQK